MAVQNFFDLNLKKVTTGAIIKAFRKNFQITQSDLAKITGIVETNLSAIENDKVEIGVKRAVLIATALGIDPSQLLFPNGVKEDYSKEVHRVQQISAKIMAKKKVS
jgi:transcriptional regulator with XRE-family HTH domain